MENAATMGTLLHEMGLVLQGLIDAGYSEQFERIIFNTTSDFYLNFPDSKEYFALFVEDGILKYFPFDDQDDAEKALACFKRTGDTTQYRIVSRVIAKLEYLNPAGSVKDRAAREMIADAEEARQKQQELIDFVFSSK